MNQKINVFRIALILIFVFFIGCGSGNSPRNVVSNYINGIQNFNAELVWKNSRFESFDETLLKEEKEKRFQDYKKDFDKKEHERFKLFTPNAASKIFSIEKDDSKHKVFVELNYPVDKAFKLDKFKTAKKLKITFLVRNEKGFNYVDDVDWKVIEYNKPFDNKILVDFVKENRGKDLSRCYEKCKDAVEDDEEYFKEIKDICINVEAELLPKEMNQKAIDSVKLEKEDYEYNTSSYKKADTVYYTHEGNTTFRHVHRGGTHTNIYGVTIKGHISNKFKVRSIKIEVDVQAVSEKGEYGMLFGRETWGGKRINDSFTIEVPPGGIGFSKYYDLTTAIRYAVAPPSGWGGKERKGTYLKSSPQITLSVL